MTRPQAATPHAECMRAVLLNGHGGFEQLEYREDVPKPAPGHGEVLVRIHAAGVNNTDINLRVGWYSRSVTEATDRTRAGTAGRAEDAGWTGTSIRFPLIQGADACGVIVGIGANVDPARIGERVLIDPILPPVRAGAAPTYFGSDRDGAFAEFTTVPSANACTIASPLTDVELASFPCAYGAAENMLNRSAVQAGESVLVTGASGGVGSAAVQLARRRGASVIALASSAKAPALRSLGAHTVLDRDTDLVGALGAESIDVVIDVAGGAQFPHLLDILKRRGRYATAGAIAGPIVELDLRTLYLKDLRLLGCTVLDSGVFGRLIGYIERGEIQPLVSAVYPLREIAAAQQAFLSRTHVGKIVLAV